MKCVVVLIEVEELTLQQLLIDHPYQAGLRSSATGLLMLASGKLRPMGGAKLGVGGQSVYNWTYV